MPSLRLIQGTPAPDTKAQRVRDRVKAANKPKAMAQCQRCGGREFLETKTGAMFTGDRFSGGTKNLICVGCLLKGERMAI